MKQWLIMASIEIVCPICKGDSVVAADPMKMGVDRMLCEKCRKHFDFTVSHISDEPLQYYTLEQIKAAYWGQFHAQGEVFFDYLSNAAEESTQSYFDEFLEELGKVAL